MKKTILLLASVIAISTSFAQFKGGKDIVTTSYNKGYDKGTYFFSAKDKDMQIAQINKDYDSKVMAVKSKLFVSRAVKNKKVAQLQAQRQQSINTVNAKFYDKKNLFNQQGKKFDGRKDDRGHH